MILHLHPKKNSCPVSDEQNAETGGTSETIVDREEAIEDENTTEELQTEIAGSAEPEETVVTETFARKLNPS